MTEHLTDKKLTDLAEAVAVDKNLLKLGLNLGIKESKVRMYISTNKRNDSFEGTSSMLSDWKRDTPKAKQIPDLIKALTESGFAELVDEFFSTGGVATHGVNAGSPSTAASFTDNAHLMAPAVGMKDDDILVEVAKMTMQNEDIDDLGRALGIEVPDIYAAQVQNRHGVTSEGSRALMRKWYRGQRQSELKNKLVEALTKAKREDILKKCFPNIGNPDSAEELEDMK
ncbi:uncharacterized protein LOC135154914 isoform X2 [Lytechinus pictus]|uniref:uncharacterized protein LOC135154914 isoform X2 n=1 Tax=Lytechinus pictus TaxID=7653 RepID=UPI0030B9C670